MKYLGYLILFSLFVGLCSCSETKTTWTKEQIESAKKHCNENLEEYAASGLDKLDVKSFCDCTVKKMSQEYSYKMSQELIPTERMDLASECVESW